MWYIICLQGMSSARRITKIELGRSPMIAIGTSGWSYAHWEGILYPVGVPLRERLAYYCNHFTTVEVNSTFYHWPQGATFASWSRRLPSGFMFSVKAPRGLTHATQLYAPERWIARITAGMTALGDRRGVLLVQLPPQLRYDHARLAYALSHFPSWLRVTFEFRHPSWHREEVFALLEHHGAGYCVMSGAGLPCVLRATAPFVYIRLHGPDQQHLYSGSYSDQDLNWWADRIREWQTQGCDVLAYFNNDGFGNAVRNADTLRRFCQN
jgi:uncharacterized protein YecE (DUF72 family)